MSAANSENRPVPNSYWVIPGRLAAGEYPGAIDPRDAAGKLKTLLSAGIDYFIDLTKGGELVPYAELAEEVSRTLDLHVGWKRYPIPDRSVPRSPTYMAEILDAIDSTLGDDKTIYVHCWGGVGRTGTVVGCWLVRHGRTGEEALGQIAEWWQGMEKAYRSPISPETREQRQYVRQWVEPS